MNLQAAVAALAAIPAQVSDAIRGARSDGAELAALKSDNAALTAKVAALEAQAKSASDETAKAKADADAALSAKAAAEAEAQRLKANATTVDSAAEAKAKAILANQGTRPVTDSTGADASAAPKFLGHDGKPLTGLALSRAINAAKHKAASTGSATAA